MILKLSKAFSVSLSTPMGARKYKSKCETKDDEDNKNAFFYDSTGTLTNLNNVQIELVSIITATKLFLRNI